MHMCESVITSAHTHTGGTQKPHLLLCSLCFLSVLDISYWLLIIHRAQAQMHTQ